MRAESAERCRACAERGKVLPPHEARHRSPVCQAFVAEFRDAFPIFHPRNVEFSTTMSVPCKELSLQLEMMLLSFS